MLAVSGACSLSVYLCVLGRVTLHPVRRLGASGSTLLYLVKKTFARKPISSTLYETKSTPEMIKVKRILNDNVSFEFLEHLSTSKINHEFKYM